MATRPGQDQEEKVLRNLEYLSRSLERIASPDDGVEALMAWDNYIAQWNKAAKNLIVLHGIRLGQAAKTALESEQHSDAALLYLFQSKNADFHNPTFVADYNPEVVQVGNLDVPNVVSVPATLYPNLTMRDNVTVRMRPDGTILSVDRLPDISPVKGGGEPTVKIHPGGVVTRRKGHIQLSEVKNRGVKYNAPTLGASEDNARLVAEYGARWIRDKLAAVRQT